MSDIPTKEILAKIDEDRLVATARSLVDIPSPTGSEQEMGERMPALLDRSSGKRIQDYTT